jgi:hypothetical protein
MHKLIAHIFSTPTVSGYVQVASGKPEMQNMNDDDTSDFLGPPWVIAQTNMHEVHCGMQWWPKDYTQHNDLMTCISFQNIVSLLLSKLDCLFALLVKLALLLN